jgi:hypothetical protein
MTSVPRPLRALASVPKSIPTTRRLGTSLKPISVVGMPFLDQSEVAASAS